MTWTSDTERDDGLRVYRMGDGWAIELNALVTVACPCCLKLIRTPRAARMIADQVYPPPRKPGQ